MIYDFFTIIADKTTYARAHRLNKKIPQEGSTPVDNEAPPNEPLKLPPTWSAFLSCTKPPIPANKPIAPGMIENRLVLLMQGR